jgi:hypothetical protein
MRRLLALLLLGLATCSRGPTAPTIDDVDIACADGFCIDFPLGWDTESGDAYLSFSHPAPPGETAATISPINLQALVENAGGSWPASPEDAVRAFWQLLEEADVATLEWVERLTGGTFRSEGTFEDGRLWHLLIPGTGNRGIAVEVRGPNASWETHADVFFSNVEVLE